MGLGHGEISIRGELPIGDFRQLKDNLFAFDIHRKTTTKQQ
jgi:hypothetical protein